MPNLMYIRSNAMDAEITDSSSSIRVQLVGRCVRVGQFIDTSTFEETSVIGRRIDTICHIGSGLFAMSSSA